MPVQFWLPDYLLVKPLSLLGVGMFEAYYAFDFVLPLILFLLTYSVFFLISRLRIISLGSSILLHFGLYLSVFNRSPSPQLNFIFFLTLAYFFIRFVQSKKWSWAILMGGNLGLLFHLYTYYWTFYVVVIGLFFLGCLIWFRKEGYISKLIAMFGIAGIIGIPYFLQNIAIVSLPTYSETLIRLGILDTRFPSAIKAVFVASILLLIGGFLYYKGVISRSSKTLLFLAAVVGSVVVVNHHVITGKNLEFSSHYARPMFFWFFFSFVYLLSFVLLSKRCEKNKKKLSVLFLVVCCLLSFSHTVKTIERQSFFEESEITWQEYAPVFSWLEEHTSKDSVVFANSDMSNLIPIYTNNNVLFSRLANLHFMSDREVQERFFVNHYWETFDVDFLKNHERSLWGTIFINSFGHARSEQKVRKLLFLDPLPVEEGIPALVIDEAKVFGERVQSETLESFLSEYQVEYLVWDQIRNPDWRPTDISVFSPVVTFDGFVIYEVRS